MFKRRFEKPGKALVERVEGELTTTQDIYTSSSPEPLRCQLLIEGGRIITKSEKKAIRNYQIEGAVYVLK
ncbi:MAG: hypothetical protein CMH64_01060 [Nanoarchaeota archaeon]|nr:hypothetical protein [Nanoarchaeota archaeon]|tara:strand:- start:845 stop:1054 length:210 start_codon:yes stop_codon:yes gene_type:complete